LLRDTRSVRTPAASTVLFTNKGSQQVAVHMKYLRVVLSILNPLACCSWFCVEFNS
jgi:hypothetical protein